MIYEKEQFCRNQNSIYNFSIFFVFWEIVNGQRQYLYQEYTSSYAPFMEYTVYATDGKVIECSMKSRWGIEYYDMYAQYICSVIPPPPAEPVIIDATYSFFCNPENSSNSNFFYAQVTSNYQWATYDLYKAQKVNDQYTNFQFVENNQTGSFLIQKPEPGYNFLVSASQDINGYPIFFELPSPKLTGAPPDIQGSLTIMENTAQSISINDNGQQYSWQCTTSPNLSSADNTLNIPNNLSPGNYIFRILQNYINYDLCMQPPSVVLSIVVKNAVTNTGDIFNTVSASDNAAGNNSVSLQRLPSSANVTQSGAASYTIPVPLPEGIAGLKPSLVLNYNSQAGDGMAGVGWNLQYNSTIVRGNKNAYYNGFSEKLNLNTEDNFYLDGQLLLPVNGYNGEDGTIYKTENESYAKIESFGGSNGNPQWWKVTQKDGSAFEFGKQESERLVTENINIAWALSVAIDVNLNTITYTYQKNQNELVPAAINYANTQITFTYAEKNSKNVLFENGQPFAKNKLLKEITVANNGNQQTLKLYHQINEAKDYLIKVDLISTDNTSATSVAFDYGLSSTNEGIYTHTGNHGKNVTFPEFLPGDYDGDGKTDLLLAERGKIYAWENGNSYLNSFYNTSFNVISNFQRTSSGETAINEINKSCTPVSNSIPGYNDYTLPLIFLNGDFTLKGKDEVLRITRLSHGYHNSVGDYKEDGMAFAQELEIFTINKTNSSINVTTIPLQLATDYAGNKYQFHLQNNNSFLEGDFNGDGKLDILSILATGVKTGDVLIKKWWWFGWHYIYEPRFAYNYKAFFSNADNQFTFSEINNFNAANFTGKKLIIPFDADGDGKTELLTVEVNYLGEYWDPNTYEYSPMYNSILKTYSIKATSYGSGYYCSFDYNNGITYELPVHYKRIITGDYNGDHKTDVLFIDINDNTTLLYNTGTGFVKGNFGLSSTLNLYNNVQDVLASGDYNGDGITDLLHFRSNGAQNVYFFKGATYDESSSMVTPIVNVKAGSSYNPFVYDLMTNFPPVSGDFDGDGKTDLIQDFGNGLFRVLHFVDFNNQNAGLLKKVTDAWGNEQQFIYNALTDKAAGIYATATNAYNQSPVHTIALPLKVVSSFVQKAGNTGNQVTQYKYKNATVHRLKGFLGFQQTTAKNEINNSLTEMYSELQVTSGQLLPVNTKSYVNNQLISESKTSYNISQSAISSTRNYSFTRYKTLVNSTIEINQLAQSALQTDLEYDDYENVIQKVIKTGTWNGTAVSAIETKTTNASFIKTGKALMPIFPSRTEESVVRGSSSVSQITTYSYTVDRGLPSVITKLAETPLASTTTITYDGYGNIIQKTEQSPGIANEVITISYDGTHRLPLTKTTSVNGITMITQLEYKPFLDVITKQIETKGSFQYITNNSYDVWGNLLETNNSKGEKIKYYYSLTPGANTHHYIYTDYLDGMAPDTKTYYDFLGREIAHQTLGRGNKWLFSSVSYDKLNQKNAEVSSHYDNETPIKTIYNYDALNRLTTVNNLHGTTSYSYQYGNGTSTVNSVSPSGKAQSKTTDATGVTINSADDGGTITYEYNAFEKAVKTIVNGIVMQTSVYDQYGRQTQLTDANAGNITYEYNAAGLLYKQTDATGLVTTNSYDILGRLLQRTNPEGVTNYEYYNDANNQNVKTITNTNHTVTFTYNDYGQVTGQKDVITGKGEFITANQYNVFGKQTAVIHPNNVRIDYLYDNTGVLEQLKTGAKTLYKTDEENGLGQITKYTLVNNIQTTNSYTNTVLTRTNAGSVFDLAYNFETSSGNLLSRTDQLHNITEEFTYDNLDRLTSAKVNGVQQFAITYDGNNGASLGNITSKTDAGTYVYRNDKPHAVAYIYPVTAPFTNPQNTDYNFNVTYSSFQRPLQITKGSATLQLKYGVDDERVLTTQTVNGQTEEHLFLGAYEKQTIGSTVNEIIYVSGGSGLCAMIVNNQANAVYTDYLGSILTVTNEAGVKIAEQNFDAWGRKRNAIDWTYNNIVQVPAWLYRGYTGHEYMEVFGLINMNARLYDPLTGRMLNPDNYVNGSLASQAFNRYSYANNNPLKFTDPTGNLLWYVPIIYAAVNVAFDLIANNGHMNFEQIAASAISGAIGGVLGGGAITSAGKAFLWAGVSQLNRFMPNISICQSPEFGIGVSPIIGMGTSGLNVGFNLNVGGTVDMNGDGKGFSYFASLGLGYNSGMSSLGEAAGESNYWNTGAFAGYNDGHANYGAGYSRNSFDGKTSQSVGALSLQIGDFGFRFDEDLLTKPKSDKFRTGGALFTYKINDDLTLALGGSMLTGEARGKPVIGDDNYNNSHSKNGYGLHNPESEYLPTLRGGTLYGGVIYKGQSYFAGHNSEKRLHTIQNYIHYHMSKTNGTPYFPDRQLASKFYSYYGGHHPYYLYY